MIEVDVRLTPADVAAARWSTLLRRPALWAVLIVAVGLAVAAVADGAPWYDAAILVVPVLVVLLSSPLLAARRALRTTLGAAQRWTVTDSEIVFAAVGADGDRLAETTATWNGVHRVTERKTAFLLYSSPSVYTPIPKRCFASETDIERFRALVVTKGKGAR